MLYSVSSYLSLPQDSGVYRFLNANRDVIYVGKAKRLKDRVSSYFRNSSELAEKTRLLVSQAKYIEITIVESELEALLLEANLIKKYSPKFNVRLRDGKNYPLIRITKKAEFPAVLTARKMDDPKSIYFGPYPSATDMYRVLKILRRIFPFQSTLNHSKKKCLYFHLGLCPCVTAQNTLEAKTSYKKTINRIIDFLSGKTKKVIKELESARTEASRNENFEEAAILQKQIDAILYVVQPIHKPFEYEINPNLRSDLRDQEMKQLREVLLPYYKDLKSPRKIECYDISNIQGTNPTASMVVFTDGEKDSSQYRKFKMQTKGPNDFAMMQEVLSRRLKHEEWDYPDLFIVDGGKGQVSSAKEVLDRHFEGKQYFLIGLAKREEIIITSNLEEIKLPHSSKALNLIRRIRDEAHRFAITFHRKLRSKSALV